MTFIPSGLHIQPRFNWEQLFPRFWQTLDDAPVKPGLFVLLSDDIFRLVDTLKKKQWPVGTTILYRSTHTTYQIGDKAADWLNKERDFLKAKVWHELIEGGKDPLESLWGLAQDAGVELVWQVINEKGLSPDEMKAISAFELDRLELIKPFGGKLGAVGSSVSSFHRPGYVDALESAGLLEACRGGDAWFVHHMGGYLSNLALIGPNQYVKEENLPEADRIKAIFQAGYDDISVAKIMSGEMAAWRFGEMWSQDLPQLHDVNFLISEFSISDVDLNPSHKGRAPMDGMLFGFDPSWSYLNYMLPDIKEVYPDFPDTMKKWLKGELNFGARMASEHPAKMLLAFWTAGGGASGHWTAWDIQPQERWEEWHWHVMEAAGEPEPTPDPKPIPVPDPTPPSPDTSLVTRLLNFINDPAVIAAAIRHGFLKTESLEEAILLAKG